MAASLWVISVWRAIVSTAKLSTVVQILLFLPLTLATLSKPAFLLLSMLECIQALVHGSLIAYWPLNVLSVGQVLAHPFLLLVCFNAFSSTASPAILTATKWFELTLSILGPVFILMEGLSSLILCQHMGRRGKALVEEGESYQFSMLIGTAIVYVSSSSWIFFSYEKAASSSLSALLLGVSLTTFVFLTVIGFSLRRTNIIESSGLSMFLAYNVWLCGFDALSFTDPSSSHAPLLPNIVPHLQTLEYFVTNTLPKPILFALIFRLLVLQVASGVLPSIGASEWNDEEEDAARPVSRITRALLTYRQLLFVLVYSHLLLLDYSSQMWWRWVNIFFTLFAWALELVIDHGEDGEKWDGRKKWKID